MILPLTGIVIGAAIGAFLAARQGGNRLDMAQWGAVLALIGGIVGLFALVILSRAAT